jgi:hypothetical protein
MPRQYDAFFVRHWRLEDDGRRIEVVHVQTGERTLFASLPQAVAWLDTRTVAPPIQPNAIGDHPARDRHPAEGEE